MYGDEDGERNSFRRWGWFRIGWTGTERHSYSYLWPFLPSCIVNNEFSIRPVGNRHSSY